MYKMRRKPPCRGPDFQNPSPPRHSGGVPAITATFLTLLLGEKERVIEVDFLWRIAALSSEYLVSFGGSPKPGGPVCDVTPMRRLRKVIEHWLCGANVSARMAHISSISTVRSAYLSIVRRDFFFLVWFGLLCLVTHSNNYKLFSTMLCTRIPNTAVSGSQKVGVVSSFNPGFT